MADNKLNNEVLDQLIGSLNLKGMTQDELLGQNGLTAQLTKRILETALQAEMEDLILPSKNGHIVKQHFHNNNYFPSVLVSTNYSQNVS